MIHGTQPPFTHIVLTRFNVGLDARTPDGSRWLEERVALFERYTLPTMTGQTSRPDAWILFCDDSHGSPAWFRERARRYESKGLDIAWVPALTADVYRQGVLRHLAPSRPWLITTRLDNDDAIARDFVERIHGAFRERREVLNFTLGLQYADRRVYWRIDPSGPFTSLVEEASGAPSTVFGRQHPDLRSLAPVTQIRSRPTWMQVIHGRNLGNEIAGIEGPARRALRNFDVVLEVRTPRPAGVAGSAARMLHKVASRPSRWLRLLRSGGIGR